MRLCVGEDVTRHSEVRYPPHMRPMVQGDADPAADGTNGWGRDGSSGAMERVEKEGLRERTLGHQTEPCLVCALDGRVVANTSWW